MQLGAPVNENPSGALRDGGSRAYTPPMLERWVPVRLPGKRWPDLRSLGLLLALLASFGFFAAVTQRHEPWRDWQFFRYAKAWGLVIYWCSGCLSTGWAIMRWIGPRLPFFERCVFAASAGVYAGFTLLLLGGVAGAFRSAAFAVLLPAVMFAAGARWSIPSARRFLRHATLGERLRRAPARWFDRLTARAVMAFGLVCLALLYLNILTPDNANFDAIYYHLGLAEQYRVRGGIAPSPEGWVVEALPSLASTLYAWPFLFPSNDLFDAMMACAHLEYALFLATVFSLPLLVRRLVPGAGAKHAWVAMFLFPAAFFYDAGLHSGNDHIAAFWAPPLALAAWRAWRRLERGPLVCFAIAGAGALLTKYQCASLLLGPVIALFGRGAWLGWRRRAVAAVRDLGLATALGVLLTAPHWLKNWVWFGDPLFPGLRKYLDVHPWNPRANEVVEWIYQRTMPRPQGNFREQLIEIFKGSFTYAFEPLTGFHKTWPIFGPLFTLSLLWLPFLRGIQRVVWLAAATQVGIFFWYFFGYYERYLQPLVPWMAAVVAACTALIWKRGGSARVALGAMLGLVLVWGGDVYFFPHFLMKESPIAATSRWLAAAFEGKTEARERYRSPHKEIGEGLPADARLLLHEHHLRLGIGRPVVTDYAGFQTRFAYQDLPSARAVYDLYRELGVTHLLWEQRGALGTDTLAGDLRFWQFAARHTGTQKRYGKLTVAPLGEPPPPAPPDVVAYLSCDRAYERGLYPLAALDVRDGTGRHVPTPRPVPSDPARLVEFTREATLLVTSPTCKGKAFHIPAAVLDRFEQVARRKAEKLWVLRPGALAPPP